MQVFAVNFGCFCSPGQETLKVDLNVVLLGLLLEQHHVDGAHNLVFALFQSLNLVLILFSLFDHLLLTLH